MEPALAMGASAAGAFLSGDLARVVWASKPRMRVWVSQAIMICLAGKARDAGGSVVVSDRVDTE